MDEMKINLIVKSDWRIGSLKSIFFNALKKLNDVDVDFLWFVKRQHHMYSEIREEAVNQSRSHGSEGGRRSFVTMTYTPQHIANFFLKKANASGQPLDQLKLMKLVYIAYGWSLALKNKKLFLESIEAWQHGPVVPSIYHEFKHFGKAPILEPALCVEFDEEDGLSVYTPEIPESDQETIFILDKVWAAYRRFSGWDLRNKTHEDNSPWAKVFKAGQRGVPMNDDDIRSHYIDRIRRYIENAA